MSVSDTEERTSVVGAVGPAPIDLLSPDREVSLTVSERDLFLLLVGLSTAAQMRQESADYREVQQFLTNTLGRVDPEGEQISVLMANIHDQMKAIALATLYGVVTGLTEVL